MKRVERFTTLAASMPIAALPLVSVDVLAGPCRSRGLTVRGVKGE